MIVEHFSSKLTETEENIPVTINISGSVQCTDEAL